MKEITNKKLWRKIILTIAVVIMIFQVSYPSIVYAGDDDGGYGVVFGSIQGASVGLGDGLMFLANMAVGSTYYPILTLSHDFWKAVQQIGVLILEIAGGILLFSVSKTAGITYVKTVVVADVVTTAAVAWGWFGKPKKIQLPVFYVTPENIFSGEVPLLDINIIDPVYNESVVNHLQLIIASWYNTFRMIAIVGLLSVLVYIAIRILLSASADDKAKYKVMLKDWFVAFCLLFFMHYIMAFATSSVETITTLFNVKAYYVEPDRDGGILDVNDLSTYYGDSENLDIVEALMEYKSVGALKKQDSSFEYDGSDEDITFNFVEHIRYNAQTSEQMSYDLGQRFGYTIMYVTLVIYTIMFLFIYIKRLVYIIFLTMTAPLVALTYPLDKIKDGSAQGFNTWMKEYFCNLLIQPLHLFLYYVLIGTATDLVNSHPVYAVITLGMMLQVENLLRKMFGFEKSSTLGSTSSSILGGAAIFGAIKMGTSAIRNIGKGKTPPAKPGISGGDDDGSNDAGFKGGKWNVFEALGGGRPGTNPDGGPDGGPGGFGGRGGSDTMDMDDYTDYLEGGNPPDYDTPNPVPKGLSHKYFSISFVVALVNTKLV